MKMIERMGIPARKKSTLDKILDNFPKRYEKGRIVKPLKFLSVGYHRYIFAKKGLRLVKEFEEKASIANGQTELEELIWVYNKKINRKERLKWTDLGLVNLGTILAPMLIGANIAIDINPLAGIMLFYAGAGSGPGQHISLLKYKRLTKEDNDLNEIYCKALGIKSAFNKKAEEFRQNYKK